MRRRFERLRELRLPRDERAAAREERRAEQQLRKERDNDIGPSAGRRRRSRGKAGLAPGRPGF